MKTVSRIFTVFFLLAITSTISMGMGYPQDMFAEHVTTKQVTNNTQPKKVGKNGGQKASCYQFAQRMSIHCTVTCKNKSIPKKNKGNRQAPTQSTPLVAVPNCRKISIVAVKLFNLDGNDVEERMLLLDKFLHEGYLC